MLITLVLIGYISFDCSYWSHFFLSLFHDGCACSDYSHWSCLLSDPADGGYYLHWSCLFWLLPLITLDITIHDDHACSDYSHWSRLFWLLALIVLVPRSCWWVAWTSSSSPTPTSTFTAQGEKRRREVKKYIQFFSFSHNKKSSFLLFVF